MSDQPSPPGESGSPQPLRWDSDYPAPVPPRPADQPEDLLGLRPAEVRAGPFEVTPGAPAEPGKPGADVSPPAPPPPLFPDKPRERYPMRYEIAYPESLSRWKTLLRLLLIVPAWLFGYLVQWVVGAAFVCGWVTVAVKRTYPDWLFSATSGALAWTARFQAYGLLLTDRYPSFGAAGSPVVLEYDPPPSGRLSRWRVLFWKTVLLLPQLFVLGFLWLAVLVVTFIAWFAILFTGRYPRGLFGFSTGVQRWSYRVGGYFASFNDRFPPFSLSSEAGPGGGVSAIVCGVIGLLVAGSCTGAITASAVLSERKEVVVNYQALTSSQARGAATFTRTSGNQIQYVITLNSVMDPDTELAKAIAASAALRGITFEFSISNHAQASSDAKVGPGDFRLRVRDSAGAERWVDPVTLVLDGFPPQASDLRKASRVSRGRVFFLVPPGATATALDVDPPWGSSGFGGPSGVRFVFR